MSSKIRNVALLLPAFVLATGLASAQSSVKVSTVNSDGSITTTNLTGTPNGPGAKAPTPAADGSAKYWDGLGIGGASTNYFSQVPYLIAPPNPQIAAGPDDILTIVNRTISRYPNPNAAGNTGTLNPYNYPPTEFVPLDVWMGLTVLGTQAGGGALCPSGTGNNSNCVIDNASIRYDQMQGRFLVLFTVTDLPAHRSNWVLVVSVFSQFQKCPVPAVAGSVCPTSSPLFTPPVIAPIVGGTQTGGQNSANWVLYKIPINLLYNQFQQPSALGLINNLNAIAPFNTSYANSAVGTPNAVTTGGATATFLTTPFCPNGGPALPLTYATVVGFSGTVTQGAGGTARTCTNYYPTGARFGIDNDNIILTAPVLDQAFSQNEGSFPSAAVLSCAPTAGLPMALPAIFWEPDNLRGRSLASFDSQVAPFNTVVAGVITPVDYLVGTEITDNFGAGIVPQGVPGITGQPGAVPGAVVPATAGIATIYYVQPIAFSCPGANGLISDFTNCFSGAPGGQAVVAELPFFRALLFRGASTLAQVADPAPVGQGFSPTQMTTNPANTPVSPTTNNRIFVGDSRPEQVMFREGLLYVARTVRLAELQINWLGTSTVLYDILKTCATAAPLPACGAFSITGANLGPANIAFEYEWFNGTSIPDPSGNIKGFGFYEPRFESPADVVSAGPIAPISTLQLFDKLFVGMTTGGTSNTAAIFSKNYPSLWDFRPGDDAFDTIEPYLDPYTGRVLGTYQCGSDLTVTVLSRSGSTITVGDTTGLGAGMFLSGTQTTIVSISGNVITLSAAFGGSSQTFPANATFTRNQPVVGVTTTLVTPGSNQITVASATGLAIGQVLAQGGSSGTTASASTTAYTTAATPAFGIKSLTNVGLSEAITGTTTRNIATNTVNGSNVINVPTSSQVAVGETITGGITGTVATIAISGDGTFLIVTSSAAATTTGAATVQFSSVPCLGGRVIATTNASTFVVAGVNVPGVTSSAAPTCTSFFLGTAADFTTFPQLNGIPINNGIPVVFTASGLFPVTTTIINIVGTTVTLSNPATAPLPGLAAGVTSTNLPINFVTAGSTAAVTCPIIPFSSRGGASTDPNDGSLWLYGEFAKNRLSTIPGPGQWGTSVANYALSFPATDAYGNDNTYFQDVQPTGSPDSSFFTWIQLAKNLGLAVPSATGPCTINNGVPPILQPPAPGNPPTPGTPTLGCPYFGPDTIVTRAEMAYWVVKAQMDEAQITNYLCATGGDPSGLSPQCSAGLQSSSFADLGAAGGNILNPFLGANPGLGIVGVTNAQLMRYIEVMARRGYTKGCNNTIDPTSAYCPNQPVTRAQMSVFLIRAKMNNVFPTTLSGISPGGPFGDQFGTFLPPVPYFSDVTAADPVYGPYYIYIQKMRELRITNGTGGVTFSPGNNLTRKEIATFIVRAFFL